MQCSRQNRISRLRELSFMDWVGHKAIETNDGMDGYG
jgi:hypothetical protein